MLTTERLLLRRYRLKDADELVALQVDPDVRRFIPVADPYERRHAVERINADQHEWDHGRRSLAIEERATRRFLGRVALSDWPHLDETEVGWILNADGRGKGFATEAARACMTWAFQHLPIPYLTAMIRPDNAPSIRVAGRLGMTLLRDDVLFGHPIAVHAISRDSWSLQTG